MSARVDRELVIRLLQDESSSYREIARRAQCSDFAVRSIARKLHDSDDGGDPPTEPLTAREWCIGAAILIFIFGGIWFLGRHLPPPDGAM